jgi:Gas vesicle synthesis protein GvpL/GvpF
MTNSLYLYGIFPAAAMPDLQLEGLDRQPVQQQEIDGFTFLYSEALQGRYLASRKNLLGHERVLEQAMQQGYRTLLPLQFGLVITDWETVQQQLILPKGETLKQLFCKLEGHREVGVKVLWEGDRELETLLQENDSLRSERDRLEGKALSMDQIVKIGQAIEQEMSDRKQSIINVFQNKLDPFAVETIENDLLTEAMIYNAAYLIQWDSETEFGEQVEQLDRHFDQRLRIRYNNFTAPFNFVQI